MPTSQGSPSAEVSHLCAQPVRSSRLTPLAYQSSWIPASVVRMYGTRQSRLVHSPFSLTPVPGSPTIMPLTEVEPSNWVGRAHRHALPLLFFPIDTQ